MIMQKISTKQVALGGTTRSASDMRRLSEKSSDVLTIEFALDGFVEREE